MTIHLTSPSVCSGAVVFCRFQAFGLPLMDSRMLQVCTLKRSVLFVLASHGLTPNGSCPLSASMLCQDLAKRGKTPRSGIRQKAGSEWGEGNHGGTLRMGAVGTQMGAVTLGGNQESERWHKDRQAAKIRRHTCLFLHRRGGPRLPCPVGSQTAMQTVQPAPCLKNPAGKRGDD